MKECWIIYDHATGKVYSESEYMWSICVGSFYATKDDAYEVIKRDKLDTSHVGTIHLFNF